MPGTQTGVSEQSVARLTAAQTGVVDRIHTTNGTGKRLADLGFVPGARLVMIKPGAPCIVRLNESTIALGVDFQRAIELAVSDPGLGAAG